MLNVFNQPASGPKKDPCGKEADNQGKLRANDGAKTFPRSCIRFRFHRLRHLTSIGSATTSCNPTHILLLISDYAPPLLTNHFSHSHILTRPSLRAPPLPASCSAFWSWISVLFLF